MILRSLCCLFFCVFCLILSSITRITSLALSSWFIGSHPDPAKSNVRRNGRSVKSDWIKIAGSYQQIMQAFLLFNKRNCSIDIGGLKVLRIEINQLKNYLIALIILLTSSTFNFILWNNLFVGGCKWNGWWQGIFFEKYQNSSFI